MSAEPPTAMVREITPLAGLVFDEVAGPRIFGIFDAALAVRDPAIGTEESLAGLDHRDR